MEMSQLAFMHIILHIVSVIFCFWILQAFKIESWFKKGETARITLFYIVLAILLGSALSNFIMDFFVLVQEVSLMF